MSNQSARHRRWLQFLYAAGVVVATLQRGVWNRDHTTFSIFRQSFLHLVNHQNLYAAYPAEQGAGAADLFKYSPSAAVLFAPLTLVPFPVALLLWNAANAGLLFYALTRLLPRRQANRALLLLAPEMFVALQSSSSNGLVAAFILLAACAYEEGRLVRAGYAVVVGAAIKVFPLASFIFAVLQARRRRAIIAGVACFLLVLCLPLLVVPPAHLLQQYRWWGAIEVRDASDMLFGLSLMRQMREWSGITWPNWTLQLLGTGFFLLPLVLRREAWRTVEFRVQYLCSLLVYVVLFNHQAERQSYVIAAAGCVIWTVASPLSLDRAVLLVLALAGVPTVPYLALWLVMHTELLRATPSITAVRRPPHDPGVISIGASVTGLRRRISAGYRRAS